MPLSQSEQQKAASNLKSKAPNAKCPSCSHQNFAVVDKLVMFPMDGSNYNIGGQIVPTVAVVCNNCGHISLFSAGALGI